MTNEDNDNDSPPSIEQIIAELCGAREPEVAGGVVIDNDGIHGVLPENVKKILREALTPSSAGRKNRARREALRYSGDVVRTAKYSLIGACELLERQGWTEQEAMAFLEKAYAAAAARMVEEVVHNLAMAKFVQEGFELRELCLDEYQELCGQAERIAKQRVEEVLGGERVRYERTQRFVQVHKAIMEGSDD